MTTPIDKIKRLISVTYEAFSGILDACSIDLMSYEFSQLPDSDEIYIDWENVIQSDTERWQKPIPKSELSHSIDDIINESIKNHDINSVIADKLLQFAGIDIWQAERIARSETSRAENKARIKRFQYMGATHVKFIADNKTKRTCKECKKYHGKIFEIGKEPKLPLHPNCRCTYVAAFPYKLNKSNKLIK